MESPPFPDHSSLLLPGCNTYLGLVVFRLFMLLYHLAELLKGLKHCCAPRPFEKLGLVVEEQKTPEYYQTEVGIATQQR